MELGMQRVLAVTGLMVFGALNTLTSKILYTTKAPVSTGAKPELFQKPFFVTFMMFLAMLIVILTHYYVQARDKRKAKINDTSGERLLEKDQEADMSELRAFFLISMPATFDLVATAMMLFGLKFMTASIYQMLRGSLIIFSALIYKFVMRKADFHLYKWAGVSICVAGVTSVGLSNVLDTTGGHRGPEAQVSESEALFGLVLVISAQALQASQVVLEEHFMKNVKLPLLQVVGYEGAWGTFLSIFIIFPLCFLLPGPDNGHLEDTAQSLEMIPNSPSLQTLILLYLFSCSTFNIMSVSVTKLFNAVHRTMLEGLRTAAIWAFGLGVHYLLDPAAPFGEAWLPYSSLELLGFILLLLGQLVYGGMLKLPGFHYPS